MGKHHAPRGLAASAAVSLLAGLLCMTATASARSSWSRPVRLAGPFSLGVLPAQIGFAPSGQAAVAFSVQEENHPATERSFIVLRSASGRLTKARRVPASQIMDLAFTGPRLDLLAGRSRRGKLCCSSADLLSLSARGFGRAKRVVDNLTGAAIGGLVALPGGRLLAAVATAQGVWVSQRAGKRAFGSASRLTVPEAVPQTLATASVGRGRTIVAWTAAFGQPALAPAGAIFDATGTGRRAPSRARETYVAPAGHEIDELSLGGTTAAWIESWYDAKGVYHSEPMLANLAVASGRVRPLSFPVADQTASGLSFASNAAGARVLAWRACPRQGACSVRAVVGAHKRFSKPLDLGPIDSSQTPAATISSGGQALVSWVNRGHVLAATRRRRARGFDRPQTVSATNLASDVTVEFGPESFALAVWTQASSVVGAMFRAS